MKIDEIINSDLTLKVKKVKAEQILLKSMEWIRTQEDKTKLAEGYRSMLEKVHSVFAEWVDNNNSALSEYEELTRVIKKEYALSKNGWATDKF